MLDQQDRRINSGTVPVGAKMQVHTGHSAGRTNGSERCAGRYCLPFFDIDFAQVTIHRHEALAMINEHGVVV